MSGQIATSRLFLVIKDNALSLLTLCILLAGVQFYWFYTVEDAYISFRYAENLIDGNGLVYNPGSRVEGYTNFLWVICLAFLHSLVSWIDLPLTAKLLGAFCSTLTLLCLAQYSHPCIKNRFKLIIPLIVVISPGFLLWTVAGLETPLVTLLLTIAFVIDQSERKAMHFRAGICFGFAILTRPDIALVFAAYLSVQMLVNRKNVRYAIALLAGCGAIVVPHALFRFFYYNSFVPNTYFIKTKRFLGGGTAYFMKYLSIAGLIPISLAILGCVVRGNCRKTIISLTIPPVVYLSYIHHIGGDWMPMGRYFIPVIPLFAIAAVLTLSQLHLRKYIKLLYCSIVAHVLVTGFSPFFNPLQMRRCYYNDILHWESNQFKQWREVGEWFHSNAPATAVITTGLAGIIPFYSGLKNIDRGGLNDREIAETIQRSANTQEEKRLIESIILVRNPDYILIENHSFSILSEAPMIVDPLLYWSTENAIAFEARYQVMSAKTPSGYFSCFERIRE